MQILPHESILALLIDASFYFQSSLRLPSLKTTEVIAPYNLIADQRCFLSELK